MKDAIDVNLGGVKTILVYAFFGKDELAGIQQLRNPFWESQAPLPPTCNPP